MVALSSPQRMIARSSPGSRPRTAGLVSLLAPRSFLAACGGGAPTDTGTGVRPTCGSPSAAFQRLVTTSVAVSGPGGSWVVSHGRLPGQLRGVYRVIAPRLETADTHYRFDAESTTVLVGSGSQSASAGGRAQTGIIAPTLRGIGIRVVLTTRFEREDGTAVANANGPFPPRSLLPTPRDRVSTPTSYLLERGDVDRSRERGRRRGSRGQMHFSIQFARPRQRRLRFLLPRCRAPALVKLRPKTIY